MATITAHGVDCTRIPWVDYQGHRWHFWRSRGGWNHFPVHCPPCRALLDPERRWTTATANAHVDCDGHLQVWRGNVYQHHPVTCVVCISPELARQIASMTPGDRPPQEDADAAVAGHQPCAV